LQIGAYFSDISMQPIQFPLHCKPQLSILIHLSNSHRHESQPLVDIVVQFSRDSSALLLLRFDQFAAHSSKRLFCLFAISNVGNDGENALLFADLNQFSGPQTDSLRAILAEIVNFQLTNRALFPETPYHCAPFSIIHPYLDVEWSEAYYFTAAPTRQSCKSLIDV